jgi:hypothetical protein
MVRRRDEHYQLSTAGMDGAGWDYGTNPSYNDSAMADGNAPKPNSSHRDR